MYVAEEKIFGAELAPAKEIFIPLKFSDREPLGEQENLQSEKSEILLFSEASTLSMRRREASLRASLLLLCSRSLNAQTLRWASITWTAATYMIAE